MKIVLLSVSVIAILILCVSVWKGITKDYEQKK